MDKMVFKILQKSLSFGKMSEEDSIEIKNNYICIKDSIVEQATNNKLLPFVAKLMINLGLDVEYWDHIRDEFERKNNYILEEVKKILTSFQENNIDKTWPIENFGALMCAKADVTLFSSGDVDIYVGYKDIEKVDEVMFSLGYKVINDNEWERTSYQAQENGIVINLMWEWQARRNIPMPSKFNDFVKGVCENGINQLTPEELIYQCLLHASVHSYVKKPGIKLYFDIGLLAEKYDIDWGFVMRYAEIDGYMYRIALAAYLSVKYVNANIPEKFYLPYLDKLKHKKIILNLLNLENKTSSMIGAYDTLKIDAYCDNISLFNSILKNIFPDKIWIKNKFSGRSLLYGYTKHISNIICGILKK